MKVILLKDVAKIGRRGEVKDVPGGHALNFLIPRKLATPATQDALRRHQAEVKNKEVHTERQVSDFKTALTGLEGKKLSLAFPANAQGHLFESIRPLHIVEALAKEGVQVEESEVKLDEHIKNVGEHVIALRRGDAQGTVTILVTSK